jgi:hypothetical protein
MRGYLAVALVSLALGAGAQNGAQQPQQPPTPDEIAFSRLPQDVQSVLSGLPAREALQKYDYARQNLIATGTPNPSAERLRAQLEAVLAPRYTAVQSWSAGATSYPPLSPLVPANAFEYR